MVEAEGDLTLHNFRLGACGRREDEGQGFTVVECDLIVSLDLRMTPLLEKKM